MPVVYELVSDFEGWLTPRLGRLVNAKLPGDDEPITAEQETLATAS